MTSAASVQAAPASALPQEPAGQQSAANTAGASPTTNNIATTTTTTTNYRAHFPANQARVHQHRNHHHNHHHPQQQHHNNNHHHHHHHNQHRGAPKGAHRMPAAQPAHLLQPNDFRNASSSSASSSSLHSSDCSSANSLSAGTQSHHRGPQQQQPLAAAPPPPVAGAGPPVAAGAASGPPYYVELHVNAGEVVSLQLFGGQEQLVAGPTTVTMISQQHNPPVPIPVQVPPGHMIHQIADENGILKHIILSVETDEGPHLDSTVINLPQGAFRMDASGELVSTATLPAAAPYYANYDGYRAPSMLVMGNNTYAPVYTGYEQHSVGLEAGEPATVAPAMLAGGYRGADGADMDAYAGPQHHMAGDYNGTHTGKTYDQEAAKLGADIKRQHHQHHQPPAGVEKQASPPANSGSRYTGSTNVKVISNNHVPANNKNGVPPTPNTYHNHNLHHQHHPHHHHQHHQHLNNHHHHMHHHNQHHHPHHHANQAHNNTNQITPARAHRNKGSPHHHQPHALHHTHHQPGKQQYLGTSNLSPVHDTRDPPANHQTNFHHSSATNATGANHVNSLSSSSPTSNSNNDSISSNNSNNDASSKSNIVHSSSDEGANKSCPGTKQALESGEPAPCSPVARNKLEGAVESNPIEPLIHKSKSFDNSSLSQPNGLKQQQQTRQKSTSRSAARKSINGVEPSTQVSKVHKEKSTSRGVSLSSGISEGSPKTGVDCSSERICDEPSTGKQSDAAAATAARTSRGKQKCQKPKNSHSQDERSSKQPEQPVPSPSPRRLKDTNKVESRHPPEATARKRSDPVEVHRASVKTPEVHSVEVKAKRASAQSSDRHQARGKQQQSATAKDKSVAIKQTSETIEAMKLEAATIIACDKKDKSEPLMARVEASAKEPPMINIPPPAKVKAIKTPASDEQRPIAAAADSDPSLQQSKHKNHKHNNNNNTTTCNTCKTSETVASNKHQLEQQSVSASKKSKSGGAKQAGKRGSINHQRQNNQSLKELHQVDQQADVSLVSAPIQSTSSGLHRGYPSSHSSNNNHNHHQHHQNGAARGSAPQPIKLSSLIRQCRTKVVTLLGRLVKSSLSSCSNTKFVSVVLVLFTCISALLAMCIHSFIVAPVTE